MTTKVFEGVRSFPNNAALAQGIRVLMSGGYLAAAGATSNDIGVMENRSFATDPMGSVRLSGTTVTQRMMASGAITQYADVYRAASGKISATASGIPYGIALEAASGDGSLIEVLPYKPNLSDVLGVGVNYKIARGQATTQTASDTIVTGLTTVVAAIANLQDAPIVAAELATASIGDQAGTPAAGSILLQTWKTMGGTPVAATTFSLKANWIAIGT
jgi:hypothetical protein